MNQEIAQIALMFVLPLGVTFITILQSASAEYRSHKIAGSLLSLAIVAMDCMFYFMKNSFVSYNCDGGLLLAFASLFLFGILYVIRSETIESKIANGIFSALAFAAFLGIAYWERPTLLVNADYTAEELARQNAIYQDYIGSFQKGNVQVWNPTPQASAPKPGTTSTDGARPQMSDAARSRLDKYVEESNKVIERMEMIVASIDNFEPIQPNISDSEREIRGNQALAINNNATNVNKKTLGLFHPHESSEAHSELIQASENLRLAAYSLYNYTLQENSDEQKAQYSQCRNQIAQFRIYLERFRNDIQNLKTNYQPQQEEN